MKKNKKKEYNEIIELSNKLTKAGVAHTLRVLYDGYQIKIDENSIIQHSGSYGHEDGLLEVMGEYSHVDGDVEGYLSVDEMFRRILASEIKNKIKKSLGWK